MGCITSAALGSCYDLSTVREAGGRSLFGIVPRPKWRFRPAGSVGWIFSSIQGSAKLMIRILVPVPNRIVRGVTGGVHHVDELFPGIGLRSTGRVERYSHELRFFKRFTLTLQSSTSPVGRTSACRRALTAVRRVEKASRASRSHIGWNYVRPLVSSYT